MSSKPLFILFILSLLLNVYLLFFVLKNTPTNIEEAEPQATETTQKEEPKEEVFESGKTYPLMRIVDGDTIIVGFENSTEYVRLIGIDAPELNDPAGTECYAQESTKHLQDIAQTGIVVLHFDASQSMRDSYGRLLAYVELPEGGGDLGERMLKDGYAREYTYNAEYTRQNTYIAAEETARNEKQGLWAETACK